MLLGNPPGVINNRVRIDLRDPFDALVDSLEIEDGNATSTLDEAVFRVWTGELFLDRLDQGAVTPRHRDHVRNQAAAGENRYRVPGATRQDAPQADECDCGCPTDGARQAAGGW